MEGLGEVQEPISVISTFRQKEPVPKKAPLPPLFLGNGMDGCSMEPVSVEDLARQLTTGDQPTRLAASILGPRNLGVKPNPS